MNLTGAFNLVNELKTTPVVMMATTTPTGYIGWSLRNAAVAVAVKLAFDQSKYSGYFSFVSADFVLPESKYHNYEGDMEMFNGLESIGGQGTKYKEARDFLLSVDLNYRWRVIVACTILLDKPSSVVLGGFTGPEKAKLRAYNNKVTEAKNSLENTLGTFAQVYDATTSSGDKDKVMLTCLASVAQFLRQENNVVVEDYDVSKYSKEFREAFVKVLVGAITTIGFSKHYANISLSELEAIKVKGCEIRLRDAVKDYLPMMSTGEIASRSDTDAAAMQKTREHWPDCFKRVNISRAKTIALMSLQYRERLFKIQKEWVEKHFARPFRARPSSKANSRTKEIWMQTMKKFKDDKKYHNPKEVRYIFAWESSRYVGDAGRAVWRRMKRTRALPLAEPLLLDEEDGSDESEMQPE